MGAELGATGPIAAPPLPRRHKRCCLLPCSAHHLVPRWRSTIALNAAFSASLRGEFSSVLPSSASAETARTGKLNCLEGTDLTRFFVTCTLRRIALTCQPRFNKLSCSFGSCCFSFAASAALGVDSTSCPASNISIEQASNIAGRVAEQSFCNAAIRVTVGRIDAILSCARKKSAAPFAAGVRRVPC